jgi:anthranilate phosphoribosyltransferase
LSEQLRAGQALEKEQANQAVQALLEDAASTEDKAAFLTALALKGESTDEIAAFALALRARSILPPLDPETRAGVILDVCGTGGDRLNTFNISTTVALVAASAGITVAKHGNRAITSQAGSADVLEALGIRIDQTPEEAARALREHQFAFLFAQHYHPAFKNLAPARKLCAERGQRTIFNILGPLLNPARPTAQLVGVPRPQLCEPIGRVLQLVGVGRGFIVSGLVQPSAALANGQPNPPAYLDELSTLGENVIAEFYQDRAFSTSVLSIEHFPLQPATLADLAGGDRQDNAQIVRRLLSGEERGPKRDAVLLNSAAALLVAGKVRSLSDGWEAAAELLDSGRASAKLNALVKR